MAEPGVAPSSTAGGKSEPDKSQVALEEGQVAPEEGQVAPEEGQVAPEEGQIQPERISAVDIGGEISVVKDTRWVDRTEFMRKISEAKDDIMKKCTIPTQRIETISSNVIKTAVRLGAKLRCKELKKRLEEIEATVLDYQTKISAMDVEFSYLLTTTQEELSNMDETLEDGVEKMNEALANRVPDTEGIADLSHHFTKLQEEFNSTAVAQMEFRNEEIDLETKIEKMKKAIKELEAVKAAHEEVDEALSAKASMFLLNSMVTKLHYGAVLAQYHKKLTDALDRTNYLEGSWQRVIDDFYRECNEKASQIQVNSYANDFRKKSALLTDRVDFLLEVVDNKEYNKTSDDTSILIRDKDCMSCGVPPYKPKRFVKIRSRVQPVSESPPESSLMEQVSEPEDGAKERAIDTESIESEMICYPEKPIPHPMDPRGKVCSRVCGGSYLIRTRGDHKELRRAIKIGKMKTSPGESLPEKLPCIPCNLRPKPVRRRVKRKVVLEEEEEYLPEDVEPIEEGIEEEELESEESLEGISDFDRFLHYSKYWSRKDPSGMFSGSRLGHSSYIIHHGDKSEMHHVTGKKSGMRSMTGKKSEMRSMTGKKSEMRSVTGKKSEMHPATGKKSEMHPATGKKSEMK